MTHLPGNAYTRRNSAYAEESGWTAYEVVEALGDPLDEPTVIARVELRPDGCLNVFANQGMTQDQAMRVSEVLADLACGAETELVLTEEEA